MDDSLEEIRDNDNIIDHQYAFNNSEIDPLPHTNPPFKTSQDQLTKKRFKPNPTWFLINQ